MVDEERTVQLIYGVAGKLARRSSPSASRQIQSFDGCDGCDNDAKQDSVNDKETDEGEH